MKVTQKILSIPPYVSTAWKNVISLHLSRRGADPILVIGLVNGSTIEIPNLDIAQMEVIFNAHQKYLEQESHSPAPQKGQIPPSILPEMSGMENPAALLSLPLRFGIDGNLLQHNPDASDSPNLPQELLEKIATFSKAIGAENSDNFPKPEPHCNCMHCQIMRVLRQDSDSSVHVDLQEDEVSDKDLKFRDWDIAQTGEKLFVVSNPLNTEEHYNVFLGNPIGCTCGDRNCEHIRAVLNT